MHEFSQTDFDTKKVALVGVGALGTVIANRLVRAGVGELRLIDRDFVEESNLQRQMLFDERDAAERLPKAVAATRKLRLFNPEIKFIPFVDDLHPGTVEDMIQGVDLILDGTDNMETRFLLNDVSIKHRIPWIYGGVIQSRGVTTTIVPGKTPCFRCLFHQATGQHGQTCDTVGVISPIVNIIAALQVTEAFKLLSHNYTNLQKQLIQVDIWNHDVDYLPIEQSINPDCPACQQHSYDYLDRKQVDQLFSQLCGRDSIQITPHNKQKINLERWQKKWSGLGKTERNSFLLRLFFQGYRITLFPNGRVLVQGTNDMLVAKKIYSQLMGQ